MTSISLHMKCTLSASYMTNAMLYGSETQAIKDDNKRLKRIEKNKNIVRWIYGLHSQESTTEARDLTEKLHITVRPGELPSRDKG